MDPTPDATVPIPKSLLETKTGCKVLSYEVESGSKPGDNYMSIIYSIKAEVIPPDSEITETRYYMLKCYPQHPSRQEYLNEINLFHKELKFYTDWVTDLIAFQREVLNIPEDLVITPAYPPCFGGEAVDYANPTLSKSKVSSVLDNYILMTDLKRSFGYEMVEKSRGLDLDHLKLLFRELGTIHALSWAYKIHKEKDIKGKFPLFQPFSLDNMKVWNTVLLGNVDLAVKALDKALGEGNKLSRGTKEIGNRMWQIVQIYLDQKEEDEKELLQMHRDPPKDVAGAVENHEPWRVIVHGDCWSNNSLFKYDEATGKPVKVMLFDFQLSREACPTVELNYCLYSSTTPATRKAHFKTLINIYHDRFIEVCKVLKTEPLPGFSVEEIIKRFHVTKPLGYMNALCFLPMISKAEAETNLDTVADSVKLDDMFTEAFGGGLDMELYSKRMLEVAEEFYNDGVI